MCGTLKPHTEAHHYFPSDVEYEHRSKLGKCDKKRDSLEKILGTGALLIEGFLSYFSLWHVHKAASDFKTDDSY